VTVGSALAEVEKLRTSPAAARTSDAPAAVRFNKFIFTN